MEGRKMLFQNTAQKIKQFFRRAVCITPEVNTNHAVNSNKEKISISPAHSTSSGSETDIDDDINNSKKEKRTSMFFKKINAAVGSLGSHQGKVLKIQMLEDEDLFSVKSGAVSSYSSDSSLNEESTPKPGSKTPTAQHEEEKTDHARLNHPSLTLKLN